MSPSKSSLRELNTVLIHSFMRKRDIGHIKGILIVRVVVEGEVLLPLIQTRNPDDAVLFASILGESRRMPVTIAPCDCLSTPSGEAETFSPAEARALLK